MRKIKIAQIGTSVNSHGNQIWNSLKKQSDIFDIVGYAMPEGEREKFPKNMAAFEGYREMTVEEILSDPEIEAVTIETEEIYLTKYAQMAADAGKQIHQEKPGGIVYADFEKLIDTVKEKGLIFHLGYMYRYNPYVQETLERIKAGELGDIFTVEAQMNGAHPVIKRQWLECMPSGMLFFLGCHLIDLIYRYAGVPEEIVSMLNKSDLILEGVNDNTFAVMKYPNFVATIRVNSQEVNGFGRRQFVMCGQNGSVELKPIENGQQPIHLSFSDRRFISSAYSDIKADIPFAPPTGRYDVMVKDLYQYIRGTKENPYNYDYEFQLQRMVLAACGFDIDFKTPVTL